MILCQEEEVNKHPLDCEPDIQSLLGLLTYNTLPLYRLAISSCYVGQSNTGAGVTSGVKTSSCEFL